MGVLDGRLRARSIRGPVVLVAAGLLVGCAARGVPARHVTEAEQAQIAELRAADSVRGVTIVTDHGCARQCAGDATPELVRAILARAELAETCYAGGLRERLLLELEVSADGSVCATRVGDTPSPSLAVARQSAPQEEIAACVRELFVGLQLPAPREDCVEVRLPIRFEPGEPAVLQASIPSD